jgi:iron(III) transport system ATP-binding protein
MSEPAVQCNGLSKAFGTIPAVEDVSLAMEEGCLLSLVGPSGCGKTTALRLIAGFETPDSGTVTIRGTLACGPRTFVPPDRRKVGMVFQDYALFPHLTIRQNVGYGLGRDRGRHGTLPGFGRRWHWWRRRSDREQHHHDGINDRRVDEVLEMVGLSRSASRLPHQLSGGEQQRVALARALAPNPAIILLDEPFSNLDPGLRTQVRSDVRRILKDSGTSAIFVTHDQDEALILADWVGVMLAGRVVQLGAPEEIYATPNSLAVAAFMGDANLIDGQANDGTVVTELGKLPLSNVAHGPVKVVVRPEVVRIDLAPQDQPGLEVVAREFYGHDQVIQVRLSSGVLLRARSTPDQYLPLGARVTASVTTPVSAFST